MVAKTNILTRVDRNLDDVLSMLCDLPTVAAEWNQETIVNLLAWDMEWHEAMDRFDTVHEARENGLLRPDQEQRYQTTLLELERQLPTVQQLELRLPRFLTNT